MKALILIILVSLGFQAQAMELSQEKISPERKAQLMEILNEMEPEMVNTLLSDEAYEWYISQYRNENPEGIEMATVHGRMDLGSNPYEDENAPTF